MIKISVGIVILLIVVVFGRIMLCGFLSLFFSILCLSLRLIRKKKIVIRLLLI